MKSLAILGDEGPARQAVLANIAEWDSSYPKMSFLCEDNGSLVDIRLVDSIDRPDEQLLGVIFVFDIHSRESFRRMKEM